ncbi:hypothetical protein ABEB36_011512 [Hypothenemus hampei]|uniref:Golgin-84 n=1 Tax=Hypothenemus hampei TaxID=57062 RepID=A0ABD1EG81_HYPHA
MAWLQNLAGHAEDLLNKIDQNAATVLNDSSKVGFDEENGFSQFEPESTIEEPTKTIKLRSPSPQTLINRTPNKSPDFLNSALETPSLINFIDENKTEESPAKSNQISSSSASINVSDEIDFLQSKFAKLELENEDLNKQLLNIQHLYSEMRNENSNLQIQVERLHKQLDSAQYEREQYVARAQRILQEKEKLISLKKETEHEEVESSILNTYNEELKKELEFQQTQVKNLNGTNEKLLKELQSLQMQHQVIQQGLNQTNQALEQNILREKKLRAIAEDDCSQKIKELQMKNVEIAQLQEALRCTKNECIKLTEALQKKSEHLENEEYENRIKSLTQTLMLKQSKLETITTDRNALKLQLEKLEVEHKNNIAELNKDRVKVINIQNVSDENVPVSNFMRVSPEDRGMTRRVKHAYSSLDAVSIRTGIFLRRYPLARVFVFSYMVILHIWVLTVLLWDVPINR